MNMNDGFINSWDNATRAASYARLEFPNTYYLAYRDLPVIISTHVEGRKAVDFGCGTGRSSRFLQQLGFEVTGIDIACDMLRLARQADPVGRYELVRDGEYAHLGTGQYDLVQSIFTFDNIPGWDNRVKILKALAGLLNPKGRMICLGSSPELYVNEWASFTTRDFPGNRLAQTGDIVRDIMLDVEDRRPVEDIFWAQPDYNKMYDIAGLSVETCYKPLGLPGEPYPWISETSIAPWTIYVLKNKADSPGVELPM
jgi:SAM-dependent methyltransferase